MPIAVLLISCCTEVHLPAKAYIGFLPHLQLFFSYNVETVLWYGDDVGNTIDEKFKIFSVFQMC